MIPNMKSLKSFAITGALFLSIFPAASSASAASPFKKVSGGMLHVSSGVVFPPRVGAFRFWKTKLYGSAGRDVGAGYNVELMIRGDGYVYPGGTYGKDFNGELRGQIGKIDRELKKLWAQDGEAKTRASLMNLTVYSEAPGSLPVNTKMISEITEDHACRAIVIGANPGATENRVEAWINVHCHVSRTGSKQVCSEQLSFLLEGPSARLLPNIVFSQLDSDLPLYLWWQGEFSDPMDPQLWAWVDRVIYDSRDWNDFGSQMQRVETAQAEAKQRTVLCASNWSR